MSAASVQTPWNLARSLATCDYSVFLPFSHWNYCKAFIFYDTHKCCLPFSCHGRILYVLCPPSVLVSYGHRVVLNDYREMISPIAGTGISGCPRLEGSHVNDYGNDFWKLKVRGALGEPGACARQP